MATGLPWRSPQEVLSTFIECVPTFYVSIHSVAAVLPEDIRAQFVGRGRFLSFLRRYPFFFDVRALDTGVRIDVRLREDVSHPRRGAADEKFMMTDVGEVTNYVAKPDHIVSLDSIEAASQSVALQPPTAPPAVRVQLEERVPVLCRLRTLIPKDFTPMAAVEEGLPEDILYHPYFDCQGGLPAIAAKFPSEFQVVAGGIRLRPPHLAPLALHDYTLENSPLPDVAALVQREVCSAAIPHWVSVTSLYEMLTRHQKRHVKGGFRSLAGFLRAHGQSVSISNDMLQVAMWTMRASSEHINNRESGAVNPPPNLRHITHTHILNELFDRFPRHRTLSVAEALDLLPQEMRACCLPEKILPWLATHPQYFVLEDPSEKDLHTARMSRAMDSQPLDFAMALYPHLTEDPQGTPATALLAALDPSLRSAVERLGLETLVDALPEWLVGIPAELDGQPFRVRRLRSVESLVTALHTDHYRETQRGRKAAVDVEEIATTALEMEYLARAAQTSFSTVCSGSSPP